MNAPQLLLHLNRLHVVLSTGEDGALLVDGPNKVLTEALLGTISIFKAELLQALGHPEEAA